MFNIRFIILICILIIFIIKNYDIYDHFNNTNNEQKLKTTFYYTINMINKINLPYMFAYGSAIGSLRNGKLIPYDHDIDIVIFYEDLRKKFGSIQEMSNIFNKYAEQNNFKPMNNISTPYVYKKNSKFIPIMFQYRHKITNIPVDFYIFFEKDNYHWDFSEGGEKTGRGRCFPLIKPEYSYVYGKKYPVMPVNIIEIMYGKNWKTPLQKSEYKEMKKTQYQENGELDDEWLIE